MPKGPIKEQNTTSATNRRNNIRERIYEETVRLQTEEKNKAIRAEEKRIDALERNDYHFILNEELNFDRSLIGMPEDKKKDAQIAHIDTIKKMYKEAKISENFLIERSRQLYHHLGGPLPRFFKNASVDNKKAYMKSLPKAMDKEDKEALYDKALTAFTDEINKFVEDSKAYVESVNTPNVKSLDPDAVLRNARYTEFKTTDEYIEAETKERKEAERAERERRDFVNALDWKIAQRTKELDKGRNYILYQYDQRLQKTENDVEYDRIKEERDRTLEKYDKQYDELENGTYEKFTEEEKEHIAYRKLDLEEHLKEIQKESKKEEKQEVKKEVKKEEKPKVVPEKKPTSKKIVTFDNMMQDDLEKFSTATLAHFSSRMRMGLDYAVKHNGRIDRSILLPAFDELSELTVIQQDTEKEYQKQYKTYQNDVEKHEKSKPWFLARWFNTSGYKKWKKEGEELGARGNKIAKMHQNSELQKDLVNNYKKSLKEAGVSQSMIDKCSTYENVVLGAQVSEAEIKHEVINCKKKFDDKISELQKDDNLEEIRRIYKERSTCNGMIKTMRGASGVSTEEYDELYPVQEEKVVKEEAKSFDERMQMDQTQNFYSDFTTDFFKEDDKEVEDEEFNFDAKDSYQREEDEKVNLYSDLNESYLRKRNPDNTIEKENVKFNGQSSYERDEMDEKLNFYSDLNVNYFEENDKFYDKEIFKEEDFFIYDLDQKEVENHIEEQKSIEERQRQERIQNIVNLPEKERNEIVEQLEKKNAERIAEQKTYELHGGENDGLVNADEQFLNDVKEQIALKVAEENEKKKQVVEEPKEIVTLAKFDPKIEDSESLSYLKSLSPMDKLRQAEKIMNKFSEVTRINLDSKSLMGEIGNLPQDATPKQILDAYRSSYTKAMKEVADCATEHMAKSISIDKNKRDDGNLETGRTIGREVEAYTKAVGYLNNVYKQALAIMQPDFVDRTTKSIEFGGLNAEQLDKINFDAMNNASYYAKASYKDRVDQKLQEYRKSCFEFDAEKETKKSKILIADGKDKKIETTFDIESFFKSEYNELRIDLDDSDLETVIPDPQERARFQITKISNLYGVVNDNLHTGLGVTIDDVDKLQKLSDQIIEDTVEDYKDVLEEDEIRQLLEARTEMRTFDNEYYVATKNMEGFTKLQENEIKKSENCMRIEHLKKLPFEDLKNVFKNELDEAREDFEPDDDMTLEEFEQQQIIEHFDSWVQDREDILIPVNDDIEVSRNIAFRSEISNEVDATYTKELFEKGEELILDESSVEKQYDKEDETTIEIDDSYIDEILNPSDNDIVYANENEEKEEIKEEPEKEEIKEEIKEEPKQEVTEEIKLEETKIEEPKKEEIKLEETKIEEPEKEEIKEEIKEEPKQEEKEELDLEEPDLEEPEEIPHNKLYQTEEEVKQFEKDLLRKANIREMNKDSDLRYNKVVYDTQEMVDAKKEANRLHRETIDKAFDSRYHELYDYQTVANQKRAIKEKNDDIISETESREQVASAKKKGFLSNLFSRKKPLPNPTKSIEENQSIIHENHGKFKKQDAHLQEIYNNASTLYEPIEEDVEAENQIETTEDLIQSLANSVQEPSQKQVGEKVNDVQKTNEKTIE